MIGVYILLGFVLGLSVLQITLLIISCNFLVRAVRKLDDITVGVSVVMDQTKPIKRPVTTASGDPSGLVDIPHPVGTYDPRYDQIPQNQ